MKWDQTFDQKSKIITSFKAIVGGKSRCYVVSMALFSGTKEVPPFWPLIQVPLYKIWILLCEPCSNLKLKVARNQCLYCWKSNRSTRMFVQHLCVQLINYWTRHRWLQSVQTLMTLKPWLDITTCLATRASIHPNNIMQI